MLKKVRRVDCNKSSVLFAWLLFLTVSTTMLQQADGSSLLSSPSSVLNVLDFGAVGDGIADDTLVLRTLLGFTKDHPVTVLLPANHTFLSGPLNVSSHLTLQVDGTLMASTSHHEQGIWPQLPPLPLSGKSEDGPFLQYHPFLYATNATNLTIQGEGTIDGGGPYWWDLFHNNQSKLEAGRPSLLLVVGCTRLEISGVTLANSPFWTLRPVSCNDVWIHDMKIRAPTYAPNVDGVDPEASKDVMIENNDIGCGDDHIAIKAGICSGQGTPNNCTDEVWRDGGIYETNNVTVRNNIFRNGMGIAVGSATSGGVKNVLIENNLVGVGCIPGGDCGMIDDTCCGWSPALHLKTTPMRGGKIENIVFRNNTVYNSTSFIFLELHYQNSNSDDVPVGYNATLIQGVEFIGNQAMNGQGVQLACSSKDPCHDVVLVNNTIRETSDNPWFCHYVDSYRVRNNFPEGLEECMANSMNPNSLLDG